MIITAIIINNIIKAKNMWKILNTSKDPKENTQLITTLLKWKY